MKKIFFYVVGAILIILIAVMFFIGKTYMNIYNNWNYLKNEVFPEELLGESYFKDNEIFIETNYKIEGSFKSPDFYIGIVGEDCSKLLSIKDLKEEDISICYVRDVKNDTGTFYITGIAKYSVRSGNIKECPIIEQR